MVVEEDEIVGEVDVFLSRRLQPNLHIFQFPVSFPSDALGGSQSPHIRAKPTNKKFELEVPIETESKHFDRGKGEQIAYIANSSQTMQNYFSEGLMDKQKLKSIEVKSALHQYAVGILSDDAKELHITPVSSLLQFRPSFDYFDKSEIRVKKGDAVGKEESDASDHEEADVKRITVRFAGPDEERLKKARESSYGFLQQQVDSEPWVDVTYYRKDDIKAHNERCKLLYNSNEEQEEPQASMSVPVNGVEDYLKSLLTVAAPVAKNKPPSEEEESTLSAIKKLPLAEQIKAILLKANVMSFEDVKQVALDSSDETSILRYLQQYGMLIQGNWVVKSEVLYPKDSLTRVTGIPSDIVCRARDYVMLCFTQSSSVSRQKILTATKVPNEDVLDILKPLAKYNALSKMWDFLLPPDNEFIQRYSDIVNRQSMLWTARRENLDRISQSTKVKKESRLDTNRGFSSPNLVPRKRKRSRRDSSASGTDENESSGSELHGDSRVKREKIMNTDAAKSSILSVPEIKKEPKSKMATLEVSHVGSVYPNPDEKKLLQQVISAIIREQLCLTLEDLRAAMSDEKDLITIPAVSDVFLVNLVTEVGGFRVDNKWPQKKEPKTLLGFKKFGDPLDKVRDILFDMFSEQARIRVTHLKEKVKDVLGDKNCDASCKKLLKDYCVYKSGAYYLKGTVD